MVERGEVITVSRQIGGMMEAGVDILRITRVLRAQTENPRLLEVYNALDHDLTMGRSLAEAMVNAPDVWSPFDVSLVQQGESRNDIAGAFNKIADFLQKDEEQEAAQHREHHAEAAAVAAAAERIIEVPVASPAIGAPMAVIALDGLIDRLQTMGLRFLTVISGLLLALASVWLSVEQGWLEYRWINVTLCSVAALFIGGMGVWVQRRINSDRRREARCSFCGTYSPSGEGLERAPRFAGAAICARCAAIVAKRHEHDLKEANGETSHAPSEVTPNASGNISNGAGSKAAEQAIPNPASADTALNGAANGNDSGAARSGAARSAAPPRRLARSGVSTPPDGEEDYE